MKYTIFLLFAIFSFVACEKQLEKTQAIRETISESVYASGVIKSENQYQVFSTVNGLIQKILVKEGDLVKAGQPLFVIENERTKLAEENAKLSVDFAEWNTKGNRLNELFGSIETAKSKMQLDSLLWTRQKGLWEQKIGSKIELEQRELTFTNSKNAYESAQLRYADLKKQLDFAAAQSKKQLSISKTMAKDYTIRSQSAGRVYSISKEVGELVGPQSPVAIIGAADAFVAELQIDENDIVRIKEGQQVFLTLNSYKNQVFEAKVHKIYPFMNERTRTFTIESVFTKKPPILYPNLSAEANIVIQSKENVLTIPRNYLIDEAFVLMENKERRPVKTGLKDYQKAEILEGLKVEETILKPE